MPLISPSRRGWGTDHDFGLLAAVYGLALPGARSLAANTADAGVLAGTPVSAAFPVDSLVFSNNVADGDFIILLRSAAGANSEEYFRLDASARLAVFNEASVDMDFRVESDGNVNALLIDGGTNSIALGGAVVAGAAFSLNNTTGRAAVTSVGSQAHVPAQSTTFSNASSTLAIGAAAFLGIPTWLGDNATLTFTDAATLYIAGIPVASTNVAITNTALAFWVDAGTTRLDGVLTSPTGAIQRWGGTAAHATAAGTNLISLYTGTAPTGTIASGGSLYVATATNVELNYIDSAGNAQQLSTT